MPANTGSLAAIADTAAFAANAPKKLSDTSTRFFVYGTYAGLAFVVEMTPDGTNWDTVLSYREDTGQAVNGNTGHTPDDNSQYSILVPCANSQNVRIRCTAISSGTANVQLASFNFFNSPPVQSVWVVGASSTTSNIFTGSATEYSYPAVLNANYVNPELQPAGGFGPILPVPTSDMVAGQLLDSINNKLTELITLFAAISS